MKQGLAAIYRPGFAYKKAAIILSGLESENAWQPQLTNLLPLDLPEDKKQALMSAVTKINHNYGGHKVDIGLTTIGFDGNKKQAAVKWQSRATKRSPEYSTSWTQLPLVH